MTGSLEGGVRFGGVQGSPSSETEPRAPVLDPYSGSGERSVFAGRSFRASSASLDLHGFHARHMNCARRVPSELEISARAGRYRRAERNPS